MTARVKLPTDLHLLRQQLEECINQANLGTDDTLIADRYLIEHVPQIDIAAELECERSTVSRRIKHIVERVYQTAEKLGYL